MFKRAVLRGVGSGAVAGMAYGLYVAVVATPLIGYAETFESGGEASVVPDVVATLGSVVGGVLYGILLGTAAFGVLFYVLEPAIPGRARVRRYLMAACGFLVVSGIPWLVLPPVPPGVEQSLPTELRLGLYAASMVVGAVACGLSLWAYTRVEPERGPVIGTLAACVGLVPVLVLVLLAPINRVTGPVPHTVSVVFIAATVVGQAGLWALLAIVHGWLSRRGASRVGPESIPPDGESDPPGQSDAD